MSASGLALEKAPPLAVPGRFFLTAPLYGLAAGVLLLALGPAVLQSRWAPATLAAVHLVTLGVLTMTMCGAWMQLLPVLVGAPLRRPRAVSLAVHAPLALGAALLPAGFWLGSPPVLAAGAGALSAALLVFIAAAAAALRRAGARHASATGMGLALAALAVTLALGLLAAAPRVLPGLAGLAPPLALHVAWAAVGWVGLLVIGVALQVVPMFQMTPPYPPWLARYLAPALFALLVLYALGHGVPAVRSVASALLAGGLAAFAATTLGLQVRRRRRVADVGVGYWRLGMLSLLAAALLWIAGLALPAFATDPRFPVLLGALYLAGFAVPVVVGMLYRILPFLVWLHLHQARIRLGPGRGVDVAGLPNVKQVIPEARLRRQWRAYAAGYALLLAAVLVPGPLARGAGLALAAAFLLLGHDLASAWRLYRRLASS